LFCAFVVIPVSKRINLQEQDQIAVFRTLNVVSREWHGGKFLEKIPSVPLTKTYRLNHLTANFVLYGVSNRSFSNVKNVKITFFQQVTSFLIMKNMNGKLWKKLLKIFHQNHDQ